MKLASVARILQALNRSGARALVVGGLAVNAHGYLRFTKDADLAVELVAENIERAFKSTVEMPGQPPVRARYVAIPALIAMKQAVGRPQDLDDIQHLRWIEEEKAK